MEATISTNGKEANAKLVASQHVGEPNHNAGAGVFASTSMSGGPVTTGAFVDYSKNQHSLSVQHSLTPGVSSTLTGVGSINLHQDPVHRVDAKAFHSATKLDNGFKFNATGAGLDYSHVNGHSVGVSASHIPQIGGATIGANATANLWKSVDQMTRFDLNAGTSRTIGGLFDGQTNNSFGFGLTRKF